jgi:hypothetical protein
MQRPRMAETAAFDQRRVEDRYRDEYQDAHARILNAGATPKFVASGTWDQTATYWHVPAAALRRMRVRIVKRLPAPLMDGFDVRGLRVKSTYDVDVLTGRYLLIAGYAVAVDQNDPQSRKPSGGR